MTQTNPDQPLFFDGDTIRFKDNKVVRYLLDAGGIDLNELGTVSYLFSQTDWDQFCQLLGYSVSGYGELEGVSREAKQRADLAAQHVT
jgi:hypothetical protein